MADDSNNFEVEETLSNIDASDNMEREETLSNIDASDNIETVEVLAHDSNATNNDPDFTPPKKRKTTKKLRNKKQKEKIKKIKKNSAENCKKKPTERPKNSQSKEITMDVGENVYDVTCGSLDGQFYLDMFSSGNFNILKQFSFTNNIHTKTCEDKLFR